MKALRGKSGILHLFSEVIGEAGERKVVEARSAEIREYDVIGFYAKVIDVGARSGELVAPSCTREGRELARLYGVGLRITGEDSGTTKVTAA